MLDVFAAVRVPALVLLVVLSGAAVGEPLEREANEWWHLNHVCRMMEGSDDRELSDAEIRQACEARDKLFEELQRNGYCYDIIELEMVPCASLKAD